MPVITNPPSPQNQHVRNTITMVVGTTGTVAAHTVFTVTGSVIVRALTVYATSSITSGGAATLKLGTTEVTNIFIDTTTATDITTTNNVWVSTTPSASGLGLPAAMMDIFLVGTAIKYTVGTAALTGGVLVFDCFYDAVSDNGSIA